MAEEYAPETRGWRGAYRGDFRSMAPLRPLITPIITSVEPAGAYAVTMRPTGIAQDPLSHGRIANFTGLIKAPRSVRPPVAAASPGALVDTPASGGIPIPANPWDEAVEGTELDTPSTTAPAPQAPARKSSPTPRPVAAQRKPAPPRGVQPQRPRTPMNRRPTAAHDLVVDRRQGAQPGHDPGQEHEREEG